MKRSLKKIIDQHKSVKKDVLDFFKRKSYNIDLVSEFCAGSGVPLYVVYYYLYKSTGDVKFNTELERICIYYNIGVDLE